MGSPDWFRRYDKCNMPPYSQNGTISAFLGVTETIEILQPLINFFGKNLNTNAYLVIIYEKIWYFSESKTIDVHWLGLNVSFISSSQTTYARKSKKII